MSILFVFCAFLFSPLCKAAEWKRVTSADGKISALFPVDIRDNPQQQTDRTPAGKVTTFFGEFTGDGILLAGSTSQIPILARAAGEKAIFDGSKKTFLDAAQGTETSFKQTTVAGTPARLLTYKGKAYRGKGNPYQGKALFIIVNKRMYVVNSVLTKASDKNRAATEKLFGSIEIRE